MAFEWGQNDGPAPFETHAHRRLCANLSVPLTVAGIVHVTNSDEEIPSSASDISSKLADLVRDGYVVVISGDPSIRDGFLAELKAELAAEFREALAECGPNPEDVEAVAAEFAKRSESLPVRADALAVAQALADSDELPTLPDEKAANYVAAVASPRKGHFSVAEETYVMTNKGLAALTGEEA